MNIEDNSSAPHSESAQLTAHVISTGGRSTAPTYDIAPEHQHHADVIKAMDPLEQPRPYEIPEGWGHSLSLKVTALPPEQQREVRDKLEQLGNLTPEQRAAKEAEFTGEVIRRKRTELISQVGLSKDAPAYHRELAAIAREVRDLNGEYDRYQDELTRVLRHDNEIDPATGEAKAVPVYAVTGERARAYAAHSEDLLRRIRLLAQDDGEIGIEGARRLKKALHESVAQRVEVERQVTENAEAKKRAEEINRERRISQRAESIARLNRDDS